MSNKHFLYSIVTLMAVLFSSCGTPLRTDAIAYQSIRTTRYKSGISGDPTIVVGYSISSEGEIYAYVKNASNEFMNIDLTKSFFIDNDGEAQPYYDPTVKISSHTTSDYDTDGISVNLGSVARAFGVGGPVSTLLGGVNVGQSSTTGNSYTDTEILKEQPQVSLAPKSGGAMPKGFKIEGVGKRRTFNEYRSTKNNSYSAADAPDKFRVVISYSTNGGVTYNHVDTEFYVNSDIIVPVKSFGKVNDALRELYTLKPDALHEQWWIIQPIDNYGYPECVYNGSFVDFK